MYVRKPNDNRLPHIALSVSPLNQVTEKQHYNWVVSSRETTFENHVPGQQGSARLEAKRKRCPPPIVRHQAAQTERVKSAERAMYQLHK
jgi:hypothetical protein